MTSTHLALNTTRPVCAHAVIGMNKNVKTMTRWKPMTKAEAYEFLRGALEAYKGRGDMPHQAIVNLLEKCKEEVK